VQKHSKNNIKLAAERSVRLFAQIPDDVKLVLGDVFNKEKFIEMSDSGIVPQYLQDIDITEGLTRITRGTVQNDSHLIENSEVNNEYEDENDFIDELDYNVTLQKIKDLHAAEKLHDSQITLNDINRLHETIQDDDITPLENSEQTIVNEGEVEPTGQPQGIWADIDQRNILPQGTKRRVRFSLPKN
jgi:hypothetical protein